MKRFSHLVLGFGIVVAYCFSTGTLALPQFPDPKDEAKLYELAKKEGTLVWYGSSSLEGMKENAKDFESKYPGIKVEILRIVGVRQYQRFLQETNAKQYIADILHITDYPSMKSLVQQAHIDAWEVPTSSRIPEAFRIKNYSYAANLTAIAVVYNVNKVTPEEVKSLSNSWKGVLDPRFKGRFAVTAMKSGATYGGVHMFLDPKYAKVFGPEFIKAVAAQKPTAYPDPLVTLDRVVAGEHDIAYWVAETHAYIKWEQGAPVRWVLPAPTPVWGNTWCGVSKYAPHPNAARLFMNWAMSEAGAMSVQRVGNLSTLEGVKDSRKVALEPWYHSIKTRYDVDWERWEKNYNKDMDFWIEAMKEGK